MKYNYKVVYGRKIMLDPKRGSVETKDLRKYYEELVKDMGKNNYGEHPYCTMCGKLMDLVSLYEWKPACKCVDKDMRLLIV